MAPQHARVAIYFDEDGYLETSEQTAAKGEKIGGPMGRHVAGKEFLTAYLRLSHTPEFYALARNQAHAKALVSLSHQARSDLPIRKLYVVLEKAFHEVFFKQCPVSAIHYPAPLEPRMAWARQHGGPHAYGLSGITHTICTPGAAESMTQFVAAPYESYDRMVCISRAAVASVRAITGAYAEYLADRFGGKPEMRIKLVHIPLGVDIHKYRPPTEEERTAQRSKFGIEPDEVVVLYLGRLLHYGKVQPYPMFHALSNVARKTSKKIRLILAGWSPSDLVDRAFREGARTFASGVRVDIMDGTIPEVRQRAWWSADIFSFPTDNLQETFPQSVIEAMACGLPVVAANWDGCKDQVVDGETGYLIPTYMLNGATMETTSKLLVGEYTYPHFMARCSQAAVVDLKAMAKAFEKLVLDPGLRKRMGVAARRRAEQDYAWEKIVPQYEQMWDEQNEERQAFLSQHEGQAAKRLHTPATYPPPEVSFPNYPMLWIESDTAVRSTPDSADCLDLIMKQSLTDYGRNWRCNDPVKLKSLIQAAGSGSTIGDLVGHLTAQRVGKTEAQAAVMWMLKYGVLERVE